MIGAGGGGQSISTGPTVATSGANQSGRTQYGNTKIDMSYNPGPPAWLWPVAAAGVGVAVLFVMKGKR